MIMSSESTPYAGHMTPGEVCSVKSEIEFVSPSFYHYTLCMWLKIVVSGLGELHHTRDSDGWSQLLLQIHTSAIQKESNWFVEPSSSFAYSYEILCCFI